MLHKLMILASGMLLTGCVSLSVQIPLSPEGSQVYSDLKGERGFLDLMTMPKITFTSKYQKGLVWKHFNISVKPNEKGSRWESLGKLSGTSTRFSLPAGSYVVRVCVGENEFLKDIPVDIKNGKHTLIFCNAEVPQIKNPNFNYWGGIATPVGGRGGIVSVPYIVDIHNYPARSHDQEELLSSLVDPDWRTRAYVVLLLGQYGTEQALPALKNLKDDVVVKVIAQRAIEHLTSKGVTTHLTGGLEN